MTAARPDNSRGGPTMTNATRWVGIAPPELRDLRDLLRHRATLVHLRTSIKNRVHALLARQGILPEHSDLFGTAGRQYLATLELPDGPHRRLDSLTRLISDFNREIT